MPSYVEHVNVTVNDLDKTLHFLTTALPDFRVRHRQEEADRVWLHVGNDSSYIAMSSYGKGARDGDHGLNHIGLVVDDVEGVQKRLLDAGYPRGFGDGEVLEHPFRRRLYFLDNDGNEYEFVEYLTDDPNERNSYVD